MRIGNSGRTADDDCLGRGKQITRNTYMEVAQATKFLWMLVEYTVGGCVRGVKPPPHSLVDWLDSGVKSGLELSNNNANPSIHHHNQPSTSPPAE